MRHCRVFIPFCQVVIKIMKICIINNYNHIIHSLNRTVRLQLVFNKGPE